jgi:hypothetical protein
LGRTLQICAHVFAPLFAHTGSVAIGFTDQDGKAGTLDRAVSTVVIAAAIIAAVRLAKVADLDLERH